MSYTLPPQSTEACEQAQSLLMELAMASPSERHGLSNEMASLSGQEQQFLSEHLASCEACVTYQKSMQYLTRSIENLESTPVPEGLEDRIMQSIASQAGHHVQPPDPTVVFLEPEKHRRSVRWLKPQMAVAATALLLALAIPMLLPTLKDEKVSSQPETVVSKTVATAQPPTSANVPMTASTSAETQATSKMLQSESKAMVAMGPVVKRQQPVKPVSGTPKVDTAQLASARPAKRLETPSDEFVVPGAGTESELYDDPVSNLVGF